MGDFQARERAGAWRTLNIYMDMDTGKYMELLMNADGMYTAKQDDAMMGVDYTSINWKMVSNQVFYDTAQSCKPAGDDVNDQTRRYLAQNQVNQNTFDDQTGQFILSPQFEMHAGDTFTARIPKVESEGSGGEDEMTTGRYVAKQVAHHIGADDTAYTKVASVRTTIQRDDASSKKVENS